MFQKDAELLAVDIGRSLGRLQKRKPLKLLGHMKHRCCDHPRGIRSEPSPAALLRSRAAQWQKLAKSGNGFTMFCQFDIVFLNKCMVYFSEFVQISGS